MSDDVNRRAFANLGTDPRFAVLDTYVPPLRLLSALGVARDEVAHSRLLGTLFDPRQHAGAEVTLKAAFDAVLVRRDTPPEVLEALRSLPSVWTRLSIHRELSHIDIVANIDAPGGGLVVGFENKIDANEREKQLYDYQEALRSRYPGRRRVLLFLSPEGRQPTTQASGGHEVACGAIGYADLLSAIRVTRKSASARNARVLDEIADHLREEIMGESDEIRKTVRELWRAHPNAMRLLHEYRPQLSDIQNYYEKGIREVLGDVEFSYYPRPSEPREIQFVVPMWPNRFPFTFMLHVFEDRLHARAFTYRDYYKPCEKSLKKWAVKVNAITPGLIDESFRPISGWTVWHRVFNEEDRPAACVVDQTGSFDQETARFAVDRILALVARLRPHIETQK